MSIKYLAKQPKVIITMAAVGCTLMVGLAVYQIMETYYSTYPIWVEQVAYLQFPSLVYLSLIEHQGRFATIWAAIQGAGERHLLQPILLGLLAPQLLGWLHAHLLITLPAFALFLGLLAWTVYKRTNSLIYAVASMSLYLALRGLPNERWGIGTGFADNQSLLLLSAAALCLLNGLMQPSLWWIRGFAILVSLCALARTTVASFAVIICAPILLIYLVAEYRAKHSLKSLVVILANVFVFVAPVAAILARQLGFLLWYYTSSNAWQLRQPFIESAQNISSLFAEFAGTPMIVMCLILFILAMIPTPLLRARLRKQEPNAVGKGGTHWKFGQTELAIGWWAGGFLGFLLYTGYTSDVPKEVMYAVPPLLLGAVAPMPVRDTQRIPIQRLVALGVIIFALSTFGRNIAMSMKRVSVANSYMTAWRQSQLEMAAALAKYPEDIVWQSYTLPDWGIPVSILTYYHHGKFQSGQGIFANRKAYWDSRYPGLSLSEIQTEVYKQTLDYIDVAIVLKDPQDIPRGMEAYSHSIAAYISERVQADDRWRCGGEVMGEPYSGKLAIYVKTTGRAWPVLGEHSHALGIQSHLQQ